MHAGRTVRSNHGAADAEALLLKGAENVRHHPYAPSKTHSSKHATRSQAPKPNLFPDYVQKIPTHRRLYFQEEGPKRIAEFFQHKDPRKRALLLRAPPGSGKTTLCYNIANDHGVNLLSVLPLFMAAGERTPGNLRNTKDAAADNNLEQDGGQYLNLPGYTHGRQDMTSQIQRQFSARAGGKQSLSNADYYRRHVLFFDDVDALMEMRPFNPLSIMEDVAFHYKMVLTTGSMDSRVLRAMVKSPNVEYVELWPMTEKNLRKWLQVVEPGKAELPNLSQLLEEVQGDIRQLLMRLRLQFTKATDVHTNPFAACCQLFYESRLITRPAMLDKFAHYTQDLFQLYEYYLQNLPGSIAEVAKGFELRSSTLLYEDKLVTHNWYFSYLCLALLAASRSMQTRPAAIRKPVTFNFSANRARECKEQLPSWVDEDNYVCAEIQERQCKMGWLLERTAKLYGDVDGEADGEEDLWTDNDPSSEPPEDEKDME